MDHDVPSSARLLLRAALYVRASTAAQTLSPALQEEFLRQHAATHGMQVVRVYLDQGRSGLVLAGRHGMQQLLADVCDGSADYQVLLIYDVSRWGRYQNIDEAGCYEFLCRRAGIQVHYCAEPFANDGTPLSQLVKSYKRSMAAEYSRELSNKVFAGLRLLAEHGYKLGGRAPYGLQRIAVSADGELVRVLAPGERKPHRTDRVRLTPAGDDELAVVRRIFALYNGDGMRVAAITRRLNDDGVPCRDGVWTDYKVDAILCSEHYWGTQVYNRTSLRLKSPRRRNPSAQWIRCDHALPPIVSAEEGQQASVVRDMRGGRDRGAILATLRLIYAQHGKVTLRLLSAVRGMPGWHVLRRLFGGLSQACMAAGINQPRRYPSGSRQPACAQCQRQLCRRVCRLVALAGGTACLLPGSDDELLLNGGLVLRVVARPCQPVGETLRWLVPVRLSRASDFVLAALMARRPNGGDRYALIEVARAPNAIVRFGRNFAPPGARVASDLAALFGVQREEEGDV